ncbi:MAG: flagellar biosynthesis protein FlhB [Helicobacteraceae bacterium]|jgi:flagellar biosynthetic protein FlhB|nr:flagellar biosynthesis protein FlhB [Helicobacteraceae bacterium]
MADESGADKTEEATPKRLEDAKKEGNVPKSVDMAGAIALAAATLGFAAFFGFIASGLAAFFRYCLSYAGKELGMNALGGLGLASAIETLKLALPIAVLTALFGAIGYIAQFGFIFSLKPLQPNLKKLNPIKGLGSLFSTQRFLDGFKITAKVSVAMTVAAAFLWNYAAELPHAQTLPLRAQIDWLIDKALVVALALLSVFFVFAIIDLVITRYFHFKRLRMSKQEVRDEYKNIEGSPEVRARIRRIQAEMSRKRMMSDIPSADVVVTNPTHFAVALRYDSAKHKAPVIVAKGADLLAIRIKEIARAHDVPIVENPPLARELYKLADIGQEIPEKLFNAVAEAFAFAYRLKGKQTIEV